MYKEPKDTGPIYFALAILLGWLSAFGPDYFPVIPTFAFHEYIGYAFIAVGTLAFLSWFRRKKAAIAVCGDCGWTGPRKKWKEAGGCPLCRAKKRKAWEDREQEREKKG